ncbi:ABC transporter substrate-binding protein [uncultured Sphaerochaeta sp.]|uniref:ABC transporter substrate-binding protein n=1 Tax=uncultured Sphaerochaeta sp. TaxID=886478 RepID=UPI002A0A34D4|nr:ABC transporter substrate-binding protein [uncultured Sphaerochaeta sp.]
MRKSRISIVLLVLFVAILGSAGLFAQGSQESVEGIVWPKKADLFVGFSQADLSSTWRTVESDNMKAEADKRGYKIAITNAEGDQEKQISNVESLLAQGCNVMVIVAIDADGIQPALDACREKNVPVIMKARGSNGTAGVDFVTQIMSDFVFEGETAGKWIDAAVTAKGLSSVNIAEIQGIIGGSDVRDRSQGFHNVIDKSSKYKLVSQQSANWSRSEAQELAQNIIQATNGQIDAIYCHNDEMALGVSTALQAAGLVINEDVFLVGVDGMLEAFDAIKSGKLSATVTCSPKYADTVFDAIEDGIDGMDIPPAIAVSDKLVDSTNVDEYYYLGF